MIATDSKAPTSGLSRAESRAAVEAQNWKLLKFFNFYRLAIALAAAAIGLTVGSVPPFGSSSPPLFLLAGLLYSCVGVGGLFTIHLQKPDFDSQATLLSFSDITFLTMLLHASGGVGSGVELLLLVAIGGTSLMLGKQTTIFYAAIATISVLLQHSWGDLQGALGGALAGQAVELSDHTSENFPRVGLFGLGLFATSFLGYTLASRLRATEELAARRGVDLANLAKINELIIQRMQSGVVVCDMAGNIRVINLAANRYLGVPASVKHKPALGDVAPDLSIQLFGWLGGNPEFRQRTMFKSRAGYALLPRFVVLAEGKDGGVLILLDDMAFMRQQAQQLKMAALARLTASIAHEIRNPLGAIANAAQLLGESTSHADQDKRLIQIIEEQSRRMNVIVQNVTQLSRRDRVNPVRLALGPWLEEFIRQYSDTVVVPREAFVNMGAPGVELCFDPDQLFQVVSNLCQNALRASPSFSGTPLIKFEAGLDPENRPYLDAIDWGKGVPPEIVENIFDPFFTTTPKGTGLGLYIARELAEGNGGSLDYHPGDGGVGSRFRVTFARAEECSESNPS
jgi:two-component system sensor histidine kinase PilS (NtrC family)